MIPALDPNDCNSARSLKRSRCFLLALLASLFGGQAALCREHILEPKLHHLRATGQREWSEFPEQPEGPSLSLRFQSEKNSGEWTLRWRQQDVRQTWKVLLNGKGVGRLQVDENDMVCYLPLRAGALVSGENRLVIEQVGRTPDDIRVGEIVLDDRPMTQLLSEATAKITVLEAKQHGKPAALPCRLTVVNAQGALMTVGASSKNHLAVRPGVIYTGNGQAEFGLPAGEYTIYAGRGFEYGLDSIRLTVKAGERIQETLSIRPEVPTEGFVGCDTHVHTLTFSGHGDASIDERVLTIAGEGIELPIATDHNRQIDYHPTASKRGVRAYFTPIAGNEVTTAVGHFNIFPVPVGDKIPDFRLKDWKGLCVARH
jgi:hypothetical protein